MEIDSKPFRLNFSGTDIRVQRHTIAGSFVYHIVFSDKRPALVITRAENDTTGKWWTSIPEGRQQEAGEIGLLIEAFIKSNK